MNESEPDNLLSPKETAARLGVTTKTLRRWATDGKLTAIRTLGGHRRYRESVVQQLLNSD